MRALFSRERCEIHALGRDPEGRKWPISETMLLGISNA